MFVDAASQQCVGSPDAHQKGIHDQIQHSTDSHPPYLPDLAPTKMYPNVTWELKISPTSPKNTNYKSQDFTFYPHMHGYHLVYEMTKTSIFVMNIKQMERQ
jgi:hypothetical protein